MPSEPSGAPEPLARLADVLAEAAGGAPPTPLELAEVLWLARHMEPPTAPSASTVRPDPAPKERPARPVRPLEPSAPPPAEPSRAPLHLPAPAPPLRPAATERHTALLAPAPPMVRHPLALQRALRPLKRRAPSPRGWELDEAATAERIARLDAAPEWWLPVLRPARERWLRLNLVHDAGPTMPVWRPLIRELHTALAQSGIFRTVTLHRAEPDGTVRGHSALAPADGRTVTLLVSDCMGPQWRTGEAAVRWYGTLHRWAHRMPLAVVQPLPEHLWRGTALPTAPGLLSSPYPVAPTATLAFTPYDTTDPYGTANPYGTTIPYGPEGAVALPVLEPAPVWLANWASLTASPGRAEFAGAAARLHHHPLPPDPDGPLGGRTDVTLLSAEELVLRFRSLASEEAFRLAGHLALGRPDLPVMRLVQAAVEPRPRPQHLAEVILSGMLTTVPGPPGSYAFRPGVRELLLRGLPRTARNRTADLLRQVGGVIEERVGRAPGEFRASTPTASGAETAVDDEPFATVRAERLGQLAEGGLMSGTDDRVVDERVVGGRYRLLERLAPQSQQWRAHDPDTDRVVTVRLVTRTTNPARQEAFLRDARLLRNVDNPHVAVVHDFGFEGDTPYLVTEHLDGIDLNSMVAGSGYRLPPPLLISVAAQLAQAVLALHDAGVAHGGIMMSRVILLPDGTVKLALAAPGQTSVPEGYPQDYRDFAELLLPLAAGPSRRLVTAARLVHVPAAFRPLLADTIDALLSRNRDAAAQSLARLAALGGSPLSADHPDRHSYHLLGTLRVELPDRSVHLPPEVGAMLAMLLVKGGRVVTHDEFREGLWERGREPADAKGEVMGTASRLRIALGSGALASSSRGYALHTSVDYVDLDHCEELVARAEAERATGHAESARVLVHEALGLWDGPALDGVPGPAADATRAHLHRLRISLCTTRAELDLELGEFERAAADLADFLDEYPGHEGLRRLHRMAVEGGDESPGDHRTVVFYGFADVPQDEDTHAALGRAVTRLLTASGLDPQAYRLLTRDLGYSVLFSAGASAEPLFSVTWRQFEDVLVQLGGIRLRIVFWCGSEVGLADEPDHAAVQRHLETPEKRGIIAVASTLRDAWDVEPDAGPLLKPLGPEPSAGWYRLALLPRMLHDAPETGLVSPVLGPFPLPAIALPRGPGRTRTVVYARMGGRFTPTPDPEATVYYEVDLTEHRMELDESGPPVDGIPVFRATGEAFWQITEPVRAAGRPGLRDVAGTVRRHLRAQLSHLTLAYGPTQTDEAQAALVEALALEASTGYTVRWNVSLDTTPAPPAAPTAPPPAGASAALFQNTDAVILGFDGTLTQLFPPDAMRELVRDLARHATEGPHPDDLTPIEVLRALAGHPAVDDVRIELNRKETWAARTARPAPLSEELVQALYTRGIPLAVVTDHAAGAAETYLDRHGLTACLSGGVHGRSPDLTRLMPHPDVLLRAAERLGVSPARCVLIGSTFTEQSAADAAGMRFVGHAGDGQPRPRFDTAYLTVPNLHPILEAARSPEPDTRD
ncbi:SAV_2336 N-terminal domain-related protein [Streptomyces sp. HD]|uniref:SAV_2336 N-terminal domain-related protein n=1 Tax=Streptomyces sp. HD TaxID=3020892 RepID=UPI00232F070E|nr:SAV_2336 N-terminal domain-related protein [Streptomyces sp. HD]MDC0766064.1 SAV_2336 N-terminal domain-related protein [Streptomyces sp. HD]